MPIVSLFLIILVAVFAALFFFSEPSKTDKRIHARLVSLDKASVSMIEDEVGIVKEVTFSSIPTLDRFLRQNPLALRLQLLIEQADLKWTVGRFVFFSLTCVVIGAVLGNWWLAYGVIGWLPGLACGTGPYLLLKYKRHSRYKKFAVALPDAIDLISRGLRAGQALPATLELVGREAPDPLGSEFRRTADEQSFGLPFRDALKNLERRVPLPDVRFLVTAILVQKETGGNLAQVLDKTAHVIRERVRVHGQAKIKTAQGRATGWILCLLPFAMLVGMNFLNPGYTRPLFEDPLGKKMVMTGLGMMAVGIFLIRRIVNFKV